jgi:hypothetical protein
VHGALEQGGSQGDGDDDNPGELDEREPGVAPGLPTDRQHDAAKQDPAQVYAHTLAIAAQSADAISGSGQLDVLRYGRVLSPRGLVGVRGAGITYDGLYYVKSVTHNIKRGAYTQNFTLVREGLISLTPVVIP